MRHVIIVPPVVSYCVLAAGVVISLLIAWHAYRTIVFIEEAEIIAGAYYQVELTR